MAATATGPIDADLTPSPSWRVGRLSLAFILETTNIGRAGGEILEPLVFAAIVQANLAPLRNDPALQRQYVDGGDTVPDELRRPISINAVAVSLRLPYETVRRRVLRLSEQGLCVLTPAGVYIPRSAIASERHAGIQTARMARVVRFHDDLVRVGFLSPSQDLGATLPEALRRPVNTALSHYMLRTADRSVELAGGVMDSFVLIGLGVANSEHLVGADAMWQSGTVPQLLPARTTDIARRLGAPHETVRRHLRNLQAQGFARRRPRGWVAAVPEADRERVTRLAADNEADLRRLFARLRELAQGQVQGQAQPGAASA